MKKLFFILLSGFALSAFSQDSTNAFDYNYKKGMEHYNKGVDLLNTMFNPIYSKEQELLTDSIKKETKTEFNLALSYLQKAYSFNPKNEKVLIALQGSYFGLMDFEKSDKYKKELEALKK